MLDWVDLLLQPVALCAWGLLILAWFSWRRRAPAAVRAGAAVLAALYLAASTPLGANLLVGALEKAETRPSACDEPSARGVFVVLAGGIHGRPATADNPASLHSASLRRVIEAVRVARATPGAVLLMSGGTGGAVREADLMATLATMLGYPRSQLVLDRDSRTTAEAAGNVARLLTSEPGRASAIQLVTSALHMRRAAAVFRRQGFTVCPVAVDRRWVRPDPSEALVPQISALEKTTAAYHEIVGYLAYRVTGRI